MNKIIQILNTKKGQNKFAKFWQYFLMLLNYFINTKKINMIVKHISFFRKILLFFDFLIFHNTLKIYHNDKDKLLLSIGITDLISIISRNVILLIKLDIINNDYEFFFSILSNSCWLITIIGMRHMEWRLIDYN